MTAVRDIRKESNSHKRNGELRLHGRAVSRGVGIGKALSLFGQKRQFYRVKLEPAQIEREVRRFLAGVRLAKRQIKKLIAHNALTKGRSPVEILETHLMILEDRSLLARIEDYIRTERFNAEWAVKTVTESLIAEYKKIPDENLRERYIDLEDIADRLLVALGGGRKPGLHLDKNAIIVAREVKPSTLLELIESKPKALVTETGGWTSHTFILARELNLPAVTGMKGIMRRVQSGEEIVVDGFNGEIILHPERATLGNYRKKMSGQPATLSSMTERTGKDLRTLDNVEVNLRVNLDVTQDYVEAEKLGARGVGLYRSEFLFNQFKGSPTEKEQLEIYRKIARQVGSEGVIIRTFDLSVGQLAGDVHEAENNPALGLRAVRLSLTNEKIFRTQLRALLRASFENRLDILLPMISDVSEIIRVKEIIEQEKTTLTRKKIKFGASRLGAMIEVPAAVFVADEIAAECDFLSLGTNDLVQYLLAADRDNASVADWFQTLHPAVITAVKQVIRAGERQGKTVFVCGEMAGSPVYAAILIGLGARELSMNFHALPRVRTTVANIAFEEAREIVRELETCRTAAEVEKKVRQCFLDKWSHIFSEHDLP